MDNRKPQKVAISAYYLMVFKTDDEKYLIVDKNGNTRVETDGRKLLEFITQAFEMDAKRR